MNRDNRSINRGYDHRGIRGLSPHEQDYRVQYVLKYGSTKNATKSYRKAYRNYFISRPNKEGVWI